jgi:hypothetical protein
LTLFTTPVVYIDMDKLAHLRLWRSEGGANTQLSPPNEACSRRSLTVIQFGATAIAKVGGGYRGELHLRRAPLQASLADPRSGS